MYLENIFGLQSMNDSNNSLLEPVMQLLLELRNEAKAKKDFDTSDKIRKQLTDMGIAIKDEKDGKSSWSIR
jgi:cysteinyl-tRNA synthetase